MYNVSVLTNFLVDLCVYYDLTFCLGTDLLATQRLKELSQTSSTADQGKLSGKRDPLLALPVQALKQVSTPTEKLSVTINQRKSKNHPHGPQENSFFAVRMLQCLKL